MNIRTLIRNEIKQRLLGRTPAINNIRIGRSSKTHPDEGSYIEIYTPDENIQNNEEGETPSNYRRSLDILVELKIVSPHIEHETMTDQVDEFCSVVEKWLPPDSLESDGVDYLRLDGTKIDIATNGDNLHGSAYMIYVCKYNSNDDPTEEYQTAMNGLQESGAVDGSFEQFEGSDVSYELIENDPVEPS